MDKVWVDHSLVLARKAKTKLEAAEKAYAKADKKLKENLAQLTKVEKAQKNVESALKSYEKQAADALNAQRKEENKMALTMVQLKQTQKQLEAKGAKMAKAE